MPIKNSKNIPGRYYANKSCYNNNFSSVLSKNDKEVLDKLFDTKEGEHELVSIDISLPQDKHIPNEKVLAFSSLENECVTLIEHGYFNEALNILNDIIASEPKYASAYCNRAQLLRGMKFNHCMPQDQVMKDLYKALELIEPSENEVVSERTARVLRKVYGQLAAEYLNMSKTTLNKCEEWNLQMKSSQMLSQARFYGEPVPKEVTVVFNPYAKLCGSMVDCITNVLSEKPSNEHTLE